MDGKIQYFLNLDYAKNSADEEDVIIAEESLLKFTRVIAVRKLTTVLKYFLEDSSN